MERVGKNWLSKAIRAPTFHPGAPATAQNQTTMITFGPTIATPRIAQKFRK
jgi:hypothetical protein